MSADTSDPGSLAILERRISALADSTQQPAGRLRVTIAQVVIAQLLPGALVKGGSGMKIRLGLGFSRDSKDLDVAWRSAQEDFAGALRTSLTSGWGPFSGRLLAKSQRPQGETPTKYVMQPYAVKLDAYGRPFATVVLEVGYDELGALEDGTSELMLPNEISGLFTSLGLPAPEPVHVLAAHHQIAQKIHACTEPGSERAHDLVDLQLLWPKDEPGLNLVALTTQRLFAFRKGHPFPADCIVGSDWPIAYVEAAAGLDVLPTVDAAATWLNIQLSTFVDRTSQTSD